MKISIWNDNGSCDQCNIYSSISCKPQINIMALKCGFKGEMDKKDICRTISFLYLILLNSSFLVWNVHLTLIVVVFTDEDDLEVRSVPMHYTWSTSANPDIQNYNEHCFQVSESVPSYFTLIIRSQVIKDCSWKTAPNSRYEKSLSKSTVSAFYSTNEMWTKTFTKVQSLIVQLKRLY